MDVLLYEQTGRCTNPASIKWLMAASSCFCCTRWSPHSSSSLVTLSGKAYRANSTATTSSSRSFAGDTTVYFLQYRSCHTLSIGFASPVALHGLLVIADLLEEVSCPFKELSLQEARCDAGHEFVVLDKVLEKRVTTDW